MNTENWKSNFPISLPEDKIYLQSVASVLSQKAVQDMHFYPQHGNTSCLEHSIQVSYQVYLFCRQHGLDYVAGARGSLLHDFFLYDWHTSGHPLHGFTHGRAALANAKRYFSLSKKEEDMILHHMWPLTAVPPTSLEGLALVWYDKKVTLKESIGNSKILSFIREAFA